MTRRQFVKESLNLKSELSNTNDFIKSILMTGEMHPQFNTLNDLHDKVYEKIVLSAAHGRTKTLFCAHLS